ncbi:MAG: DUF1559 domain-containing protein [Pirellulaceae bacterium]|nr:DUF1559 domain-containing protein [Pirellulaceae bacterium]
MPAVQAAREAARRIQCSSNLKQIATASLSYESAWGSFPTGRLGCDEDTSPPECATDGTHYNIRGALVLIMPYIELNTLHDLNRSTTSTSSVVSRERPTIYVCPSDTAERTLSATSTAATASYAMCGGSYGPERTPQCPKKACTQVKYYNDGMFNYRIPTRVVDVTDGLSSTFLFGEKVDEVISSWTNGLRYVTIRYADAPLNTPAGMPPAVVLDGKDHNGAFISRHPGGANFAFADAHVQFVSENIADRTYQALATRAGGEVFHDSY